MRLKNRLRLLLVAPMLTVTVLASCVFLVKRVEVASMNPNQPVTVRTPVRVHTRDGSTILFLRGVSVTSDAVVSENEPGRRFNLALTDTVLVSRVPLDSVVGMENYPERTNAGTSIVLSTLATAGATVITALAAVAIFGSCPTIYADSAGIAVLQAEVFANRISPLFEARDIDLLRVAPDERSLVTLEVRNEALETHYINQFELLDVRHEPGETAIPDEHGRPLALAEFESPAEVRDRAGRDLRAVLARTDDDVFTSADSILTHATGDDPNDAIDLTLPMPPVGRDSVAVVLHLRNSLLNTVLLYESMLGAPGARSLDWLAHDMQRIGPVLQLGRWYREHFGIRVLVWRDGEYREVERHPTYGPVAWRDVATVVPVSRSEPNVRIRLTFVADEWRIDELRVATRVRRVKSRTIPVTIVQAGDSAESRDALRSLRRADERYLTTSPGQRFTVQFKTDPLPAGSARTFFLASQGFYTEWVRGSWIKAASDTVPFKPSRAALGRVISRWSMVRDSVEQHFYTSKIPVR